MILVERGYVVRDNSFRVSSSRGWQFAWDPGFNSRRLHHNLFSISSNVARSCFLSAASFLPY